jgi:pimeloyl-ACP methyl ester carboxylesterase
VKSGYATSGAANLYFETAGNGPALVFLHAGVADSRMWEPQFDAFASKHLVVRYDHRSFGRSSMPEGPYALRDDLLSVLRHLGIAEATLVGCSMGGATAIDFTLEHPEMVNALALVGTGVSGLNDSSQLSDDTLKHWKEYLSAVRDGDVERAREIDAKYWIDGPSREASRVDPAYRERARQLHRENFSMQRFATPEQPIKPAAIDRLGEIKVPTLVVVGDEDEPDLVKLADRLSKEIPNARKVLIENAAHLPSLEHPELFNQILGEFLNGRSA